MARWFEVDRRSSTRDARIHHNKHNEKHIIMKKLTLTVLAVAFTAGAAYAGFKCSFCNGTGWKGSVKCIHCGGDGETGN